MADGVIRTRGEQRAWWPAWSLAPFGWLTWLGFLHAYLHTGDVRWRNASVVWVAIAGLGFALAAVVPEGSRGGVILLYAVVTWMAGVAHSFSERPHYVNVMTLGDEEKLDSARRRLNSRASGKRLAKRDPALAREVGVGRPDVRGALHAGLIDVNHASAKVISRVPGISAALARRIVEIREEIGGFDSVTDLGMVLDLPASTVEALRDRAIALPRD